MNENEMIAKEIQAERERRERAKYKPKRVNSSPVTEARYIWMAGVTAIDILTAYLMWRVTGYWQYALLWFFAGAGGLLWSERQKERIGNNSEQLRIGDIGVRVSAVAVFAMALLVGYVYVSGMTLDVSILAEVSTLCLFFFHLYQAYRYHQADDDIIADNDEALSEADNIRMIRAAHRAGRLVESAKLKSGVADTYRREHGQAFDVAYGADVEGNPTSRRPESK